MQFAALSAAVRFSATRCGVEPRPGLVRRATGVCRRCRDDRERETAEKRRIQRITVLFVSSDQWLIYTVETTPKGTRGPFGPITADDEATAREKASAMLNGLGLTVASVIREDETNARPAD